MRTADNADIVAGKAKREQQEIEHECTEEERTKS
jgi:hypothetical protein